MDKQRECCCLCGYEFGLLEEKYIVRHSVKPKGHPYRWKEIGRACLECSQNNPEKFEVDKF